MTSGWAGKNQNFLRLKLNWALIYGREDILNRKEKEQRQSGGGVGRVAEATDIQEVAGKHSIKRAGLRVRQIIMINRAKEFLHLGTFDILRWKIHFESCYTYCKCSAALASTRQKPVATPQLWPTKMPLDIAKCLLEGKITPGWKTLS